jgi:integrase
MENQFELFLKRKELSEETIKQYLLYYNKLQELLKYLDGEMTQEVVDAFIDKYPYGIPKAFLKNYFEFIDKNFKLPKITGRLKKKETKTLSPHEIAIVRRNLYDHNTRYGIIFDLTLACALRKQEVINIMGRDIHFKEDDTKMFILIKKGKGKKEREVFVEDNVARLLMEYMVMNDIKTDEYLFESPARKGYPIHHSLWNKAFAKASGKKFHPHLLRHTKSTDWFYKGIDIVRIQQRLGHSDISTTRRYINPDAKRELERWSNE